MKVGRFEDKSEKQLEWWYSCCIEYLKEKHMMETPIKSKLPEVWERYIAECNSRRD